MRGEGAARWKEHVGRGKGPWLDRTLERVGRCKEMVMNNRQLMGGAQECHTQVCLSSPDQCLSERALLYSGWKDL